MVYLKLLLLAMLIGAFQNVSSIEVEKVLQNVPKPELNDFLRYYSEMGYELYWGNNKGSAPKKTSARSSDLDAVSIFSVKLYRWLIENKSVNSRSYGSWNVICFPNNQCIDVGDVGVHP